MKRIFKSPFFISLVIVVLLAIMVSSVSTYVSIRQAEIKAEKDIESLRKTNIQAPTVGRDTDPTATDITVEALPDASAGPAASGSPLSPILEEYLASQNWLEFVQKYWDRAQSGEVEPMVRVHDALSTCSVFEKDINASANKEEFKLRLQETRHDTDVSVGLTVFDRCKPLVPVLDQFPGWERLQFQAALAGHPQSKVRVVMSYYQNQNVVDREDVPFSPAEFLIEAMESQEPEVYAMVGGFAEHFEVLEDTSDANTYAWILLGCRFGMECGTDKHFKAGCATSPPECQGAESLYDYYRNVIGDDSYLAAEQRADELYTLVLQQRWDELGINYVW